MKYFYITKIVFERVCFKKRGFHISGSFLPGQSFAQRETDHYHTVRICFKHQVPHLSRQYDIIDRKVV